MTNFNVDIPTKEFFDSRVNPLTSVPAVEDLLINKGWSAYTIEVSGATSIEAQVMGALNITAQDGSRLEPSSIDFSPLSVVNLSTLSVAEKITADGLYLVIIAGVAALKLNISSLSGSVTITGSTGSWNN